MPKFDTILQNERRLRAFTGLDTATFTTFLPQFTHAMERYLSHTTLDGYVREGDRAITYANSPLPTPADRLLFILTYLKQNAIQEVHGQLFGMSQSNVSKWVRLLLDILNAALAKGGLLPARTAAELAALLQAETTPRDGDAPPFLPRWRLPTNRTTQRPRGTGNLLQWQAERPYDQKCGRGGCAWVDQLLERDL